MGLNNSRTKVAFAKPRHGQVWTFLLCVRWCIWGSLEEKVRKSQPCRFASGRTKEAVALVVERCRKAANALKSAGYAEW